jgi:hypothetical protein
VSFHSFDRVLGELQGMLGRQVLAAALIPRSGYQPINAIGVLAAASDITDAVGAANFDFTVGSCAALSIDRDRYLGATVAAGELHIELGHEGETAILICVSLLEGA